MNSSATGSSDRPGSPYRCCKYYHRHSAGPLGCPEVDGRSISSLDSAGFRPIKRTIIAVVFAFVLGFVLLLIQNPASLDPTVIVNVYAQVFTVTIAEIAVCWAVIGSITEGILTKRGKTTALIGGIIAASLSFGVYHIAHSPPFDQPEIIAFLSLVGVVTGLVYFISRDIYAIMAFHNFFVTLGVMQSLQTAGALSTYSRPLLPVIGMAIKSLLIFISVDILYLRKNQAMSES